MSWPNSWVLNAAKKTSDIMELSRLHEAAKQRASLLSHLCRWTPLTEMCRVEELQVGLILDQAMWDAI